MPFSLIKYSTFYNDWKVCCSITFTLLVIVQLCAEYIHFRLFFKPGENSCIKSSFSSNVDTWLTTYVENSKPTRCNSMGIISLYRDIRSLYRLTRNICQNPLKYSGILYNFSLPLFCLNSIPSALGKEKANSIYYLHVNILTIMAIFFFSQFTAKLLIKSACYC